MNAILGMVVVALAIYGFFSYQEGKEVAASQAMSRVSLSKIGEPTPPAELAAGFLKVAQEHAGTRAAAQSTLRAASALFADSKFADAQAQFEKFVSLDPGSAFVGVANFGVASCLDAAGKGAEAVAKYDDIAKRYSTEPVAEDAKLALAGAYVAQNKPEMAFKLYQEMMESGKGGGSMQEIFSKRMELLQKYPYLQSNAAPARSSLSPTPNNLMNSASGAVRQAAVRGSNAVAQIGSNAIRQAASTSTNLPKRP
ncbi:MAG: tetratricopeptide repeat protein [Verrucomicrobia bacterium]|nr:tetratricopeptide repeat protein [Verrucomicrobiota bacterium]